MKKYMLCMIAAVMLGSLLCACGKHQQAQKNENQGQQDSQKLRIVTTIFPEYDWVRQILGEEHSNADLTMLLDKGVDLHSYQPSAEDILQISNCDLFIYVGGESDSWAEDALKQQENENRKVIKLFDILGSEAKEEEIVEGMEAGHEEHDHDAGEAEETEYDEHVWLSLKNAQIFCSAIADTLSELDAERADRYQINLKNYKDKLSQLDEAYQRAADGAQKKVLLFGDRFPFRYLTDDYELNYYAAFSGCSAETEAGFETVSFLAEKANEYSLDYVLTLEKSDKKLAETIVKNTKDQDQTILSVDSMQSVTQDDVADGISYLSVMEKNLETLKKVLN